MEYLVINEIVSENGIFLNSEILKKFKNKKVEITIKLAEDEKSKKKLSDFAGIISLDEADDLLLYVDECRNS